MEKSRNIKELGRDNATDKLVGKYRAKKIKSVIHFRRIMESYEMSEDDPPLRAKVLRRVEQFFLNPRLETRAAFDEFVNEGKRFKGALAACNKFLAELKKFRLRYMTDDESRLKLREQLSEVQAYCKSLEDALEGSDAPQASSD